MLRFRQHGILKKGPCATAVRIPRSDEHALAGANVAHCITYFRDRRGAIAPCKVFLQIGVAQRGFASRIERITYAQDDISPTLARVEDARAIFESTLGRAQFANLVFGK